MSPPIADTRLLERLDLLRRELSLQHIPVPFALPEPALSHILYALEPPIHEGHSPTYGAILARHEEVVPPLSAIASYGIPRVWPLSDLEVPDPLSEVPFSPDLLDQARKFSDGRHSFVHCSEAGSYRLVTFPDDVSDEWSLYRLAVRTNSVVVQRDAKGTVRIVTHQHIFYHRDRRWSPRPHLDARQLNVEFLSHTRERLERMQNLLDFASYRLSSAQVGATLLWFVEPGAAERHLRALPHEDVRWARLSVARREDHPALQHLLSQHDLATLVGEDGAVLGIGAPLKPSDEAIRVLPPHGGSRHTSARGFSFDAPDTIVVVVSADGPVRVFADGADLWPQVEIGRGADGLPAPPPGPEGPDIELVRSGKTCPQCGRAIQLTEGRTRQGPALLLRVACPVCRRWEIEARCSGLSAVFRKRFA